MSKNLLLLVTGADGFLGSHLAEELVQKHYNVKSMVLYNLFNSWGWLDHAEKSITDSMEIVAGDVRDPFCVNEAMKDCDAVMHLAALIAIPYSYHPPASYVDTNITGTLNILSAAKELETPKVIHTSTSKVYGSAQFVPITEDHPLQGQSPYSATKIGADQLALSFYRSFQLPVTIIRPFNTYGSRQSARAIIPTIITQILAGKKKLSLGSLTLTRDFPYVKDTVDGFISALNSEQCIGEVINLGTGFEITMQETVDIIKKLLVSDIEIQTEIQRIRPEKSEVNRLCSDNTKAKSLMNWRPAYGDIQGIKHIQEPDYAKSNFWLNALILDKPDKKLLQNILELTNNQGIQTRPLWTLINNLPMYRKCPSMDLTCAQELENRVINIPSSTNLMD